jgi:hypothetical protein
MVLTREECKYDQKLPSARDFYTNYPLKGDQMSVSKKDHSFSGNDKTNFQEKFKSDPYFQLQSDNFLTTLNIKEPNVVLTGKENEQ